MSLNGLYSLLENNAGYQSIIAGLAEQRQCTEVVDAAKPFVVAGLNQELNSPVLIVVPNSEDARKMVEELKSWCSDDTSVLHYPEIEVLPYERIIPDASVTRQRLRVLTELNGWDELSPDTPFVVVASARALSQKTMMADVFESACQVLSTGISVNLGQLLVRLASIGYKVDDLVENPGTMSRRGGILDVYSPNYDRPARIEFFGEVIESIRWFSPVTQRSKETVDSFTVVPACEMILPGNAQAKKAFSQFDLSSCNDRARDVVYEDMELLLNGQWDDGLQFYAASFTDGTIVDYFPKETLVVMDDAESIAAVLEDMESQVNELRDGQIERGELPGNFPSPYYEWGELKNRIERIGKQLMFEKWGQESANTVLGFGPPPAYYGQITRFLDDVSKRLDSGNRIIVASQQVNRISDLLKEQNIIAAPQTEIQELPPEGSLTLVRSSLAGGWSLTGTMLLTDSELFGHVKQRRFAPKRRAQHETFLADLSVGDYVVHIDHGVARFVGMSTMSSEGGEREYLILEYAEDGKLYVPSDQVDRVSRYIGSGGYLPALSRLNTQEWARTKERVKKAAVEMAKDLLALYASRQVSSGISFLADTIWDQELESSFSYVETPDQMETIRDVKKDMENSMPMDRLVCGDVGYGKTEVAVRAAFKAVNNGMQVAVLVPTTVLAQQHYSTFVERLAAFPVEIEMLSRFRSAREQQNTISRLSDGSTDICIGTHRLVQKDVRFKNLGLLIIDEEQKFGVLHKERLKKLRNEVDVLTLSATPIPRSLHMSLVGVRDMSTIETAPEDRLPIKTYISEYSDSLVREAILREIDRKGQVFFVHNRVQSISFIAERLRDLVPEARIAVAHGQMAEENLESVMFDFINGEYDLLVCTTIIESGLDLQTANTLIINQSDKLGLTQLYHLRGRVGRGDVRAYAYLLYDRDKRLTEPAQKRLKTIYEATELGSGFLIAMKDLEIRGAGNILGSEQSGHLGSVGFDLYCRLLSGAVEELKSGKKIEESELPIVDLPLPARIPEDYVTDHNLRLALYQRLTKIDSLDQFTEMEQELRERFGKVPVVVKNLVYVLRIRLLASRAGVQRIFTEGRQVVLVFGSESKLDRASLQSSFGSSVKVGTFQVRLNTKQLGKHWGKILEGVLNLVMKQM